MIHTDSTDAIILAAGKSERMGKFKMLLPMGGRTLVECTIAAFRDVARKIIVVGGYRIEQLRRALADLPGVEVVENADYERGMFSSVQVGVEHTRAERFFITPGDCALIPAWVPEKMLEVRGDVVIPTFRGRGGHPVLLSATMREKILAEPPTSNLKAVINSVPAQRIEVDCDGILFDIDTQEDYLTARARYERGDFCAGAPR